MEQLFLIKQAKRGDTAAFTELYRGIYKKLYQYALYTLHNPQDAEDAVSETVLDAFKGIKKLKKEEAFDTWIFRILHAKCNHKIKEYYHDRNVVEFDSYVQNGGSEPEVVTRESLENLFSSRVDLERAMQNLAPLDREIITLHVICGYSSREISQMLELNDNTIRTRESRALKRMRSLVKEVI